MQMSWSIKLAIKSLCSRNPIWKSVCGHVPRDHSVLLAPSAEPFHMYMSSASGEPFLCTTASLTCYVCTSCLPFFFANLYHQQGIFSNKSYGCFFVFVNSKYCIHRGWLFLKCWKNPHLAQRLRLVSCTLVAVMRRQTVSELPGHVCVPGVFIRS